MTNLFTSKIITYLLVCSISTLFTACGGSSSNSSKPSGSSAAPEETPIAAPIPTATPAPEPTPYPSLKPTPVPEPTAQPPALPANGFGISAYTPGANASNRALVSEIKVSFSKALVPTTATPDNILLMLDEQAVEFDLEFDGNNAVTLTPKTVFSPNATYTVEVKSTLMSEEGDPLEETRWQFTTSANLGGTPQNVIDGCMTDVDIELLAAVNDIRTTGYICHSGTFAPTTPLKWSCALGSAAYRHSVDMATHNYHQHTGSDGSDHSDRIEQAGYNAVRSAENIAGGYQNADHVIQGWLNSTAGHCDNIMNPLYADVGSALVKASPTTNEFGRYWTQNFGQPANPEP